MLLIQLLLQLRQEQQATHLRLLALEQPPNSRLKHQQHEAEEDRRAKQTHIGAYVAPLVRNVLSPQCPCLHIEAGPLAVGFCCFTSSHSSCLLHASFNLVRGSTSNRWAVSWPRCTLYVFAVLSESSDSGKPVVGVLTMLQQQGISETSRHVTWLPFMRSVQICPSN